LIDSVDVIIPTWNSMPEFRSCLNSIDKAFPRGVVKNIIVVDKGSSVDDTVNVAKEYGCIVLTDPGSLGSARYLGLMVSSSDWIVFVDSDIILPEGWFLKMIGSVDLYDGVGWFFGRTVDDFEPLHSEKLYKIQIDFKNNSCRVLNKGDRPYTHNSIIRRVPLLRANINGLNSWEDYVLGQTLMDQGYKIVEFPVTCVHQRKSTYGKWGNLTEAWSISGELKVKGWNVKTLLKPFWFLWWGLRCSIHFKDFVHFKYNFKVFFRQLWVLFNKRRFFVWRRD